MTNEEELSRNLAWIQQRLEVLDKMEGKLLEMKSLAEFARDHKLENSQVQTLNLRIQMLQRETEELDKETRQERAEWLI